MLYIPPYLYCFVPAISCHFIVYSTIPITQGQWGVFYCTLLPRLVNIICMGFLVIPSYM